MSLAQKKCQPCEGGTSPMTEKEAQGMLSQLADGWTVKTQPQRLYKKFSFKNFKQALAFVNKVGDIAEEEGHHPNIHFTWGEAELEIWTHEIDGLTESDYILAAKCDEAYE